jgi:hypothetical protein
MFPPRLGVSILVRVAYPEGGDLALKQGTRPAPERFSSDKPAVVTGGSFYVVAADLAVRIAHRGRLAK